MRMAFLLFVLISQCLFASEDESQFDLKFRFNSFQNESVPFVLPITPSEAFERTRSVLGYFSVPPEDDSQNRVQDLDSRQTEAVLKTRMSYLEMKPTFGRFSLLSLQGGTTTLLGFQDRDAKDVADFSLRLAGNPPTQPPSSSFHWRLLRVKANSGNMPLKGLRVAIDPGHMGDATWDKRTGKFVKDKAGTVLSEGVLNLQTGLLVEEELKRQGAETMVTHRTLGPVSSTPYENLNLETFWRLELRYRSLQDWFQKLLSTAPSGQLLYSNFEKSSEVKELQSEKMRSEYFILREDLWARVEAIQNFKPDLVVIIHYDASAPAGSPNGLDSRLDQRTKAFVPGGFLEDEYATRQSRRDFVRHLLEEKTFEASVDLSRSIVREISSTTKGVLEEGSSNSKMVEPGVLARNLNLTRQITSVPVTYLECAFYNQTKEFNLLKKKDHSMDIGNERTYYSNRLESIADAISRGVVNFVKNYQ